MSERDHLILALDFGGTQFRLALANDQGRILRRHAAPIRPSLGPDQAIKRIKDAARALLNGVDEAALTGMGIAAAGLITPETGVVLTSPNLLTWYNTPLKDIFEQELQLPVWVGNDANLAALGEHRFGAGRETDHLIYLTVSTGIGGGVIIGGKLLLGSSGFAGELGHVTIDVNGPRCNCGNLGCLEVMASGTAIARAAREWLAHGESGKIRELAAGDPAGVTAEMVAVAAKTGDPVARQIMYTAAANLGAGVVSLVHIFNPELVLIGGGVAKAGDLVFEPVRQVVAERVMPDITVSILPSGLGDDSGLLGAVALVLESAF